MLIHCYVVIAAGLRRTILCIIHHCHSSANEHILAMGPARVSLISIHVENARVLQAGRRVSTREVGREIPRVLPDHGRHDARVSDAHDHDLPSCYPTG